MLEWWKIIGVAGISLIVGWIAKAFNWFRERPKAAIDVKKVEQEIKSDQVSTAIEVTNLMLTRLSQAEARLTDVQDENDKLRVVISSLRGLMEDTKNEIKELLDDLGECLKINNCDEALEHLRVKHGLSK